MYAIIMNGIPAPLAQHVLRAVAKATLLLIRDAGVQHGLVFGRQRRLLPISPKLCLVERGLALEASIAHTGRIARASELIWAPTANAVPDS